MLENHRIRFSKLCLWHRYFSIMNTSHTKLLNENIFYESAFDKCSSNYSVHSSPLPFKYSCPSWAIFFPLHDQGAADSKYLLPDTAQLIHFRSYSYLIKILPFAVSVLNTALFPSEHNYGWLIILIAHSRLVLQAIFPVVFFEHPALLKAGVVQNIFGIPAMLLLKCHQSSAIMALMKKYIEIRERM